MIIIEKMAKNANFGTNGPFYFIFFHTLLAGLNLDLETDLVWFSKKGTVEIAKNANF